MRALVNRPIRLTAMPEPRLSHHQAHPHPSHGQPPYPSPYPPSQHAPAYHHSSRHVSNGPPPPVIVGGHNGHPAHGHPMAAPPDPVGPPPAQQMGNGHGPHHGPRPTDVGQSISAAARAGKEKQENVLSQLASANENTWMLIGELYPTLSVYGPDVRCGCGANAGSRSGHGRLRECPAPQP